MRSRHVFCILLISFVGLLPQVTLAQELTPILEEFKMVCTQTRDAIGMRDRQMLDECRVGVHDFYLKDIGDLNLIPVGALQREMPDSMLHAVFDLNYIDYLRANSADFSGVKYVRHSSNRGPNDESRPPKSGCYVCHKGIPAKSTMKYRVTGCRNNMRLVVVVAEKEDINLTITSKVYDSGDDALDLKVAHTDECGVLIHTWKMPAYYCDVILTFENPNKTDVTCVIALQ